MLNVQSPAPDRRPHSRACGILCRGHGANCHSNCPTCHGKDEPQKEYTDKSEVPIMPTAPLYDGPQTIPPDEWFSDHRIPCQTRYGSVNDPHQFTPRPKAAVMAMHYAGEDSDLLAVFRWIERNTQGSYNYADAERPERGVSINPATNMLVINNSTGTQQVKYGSWVVWQGSGDFIAYTPVEFARDYVIYVTGAN